MNMSQPVSHRPWKISITTMFSLGPDVEEVFPGSGTEQNLRGFFGNRAVNIVTLTPLSSRQRGLVDTFLPQHGMGNEVSYNLSGLTINPLTMEVYHIMD